MVHKDFPELMEENFLEYASYVIGERAIPDVLDGLKTLKICTEYRYRDVSYSYLPAAEEIQGGVTPVYETLEGWSQVTQGVRSWADLPAAAIAYIRRIEELIEAPVALLSTSPEREDTILVHDPFSS